MAKSYQKLIITGNLGSDPEMRATPSGEFVTNFSVAVNNTRVDKQGEVHETTGWYRVSVWGKQAEVCNQYLSKGRKVLVEGKLIVDPQTGGPRVWQDQNGKWRASFEMTAFEVQFLDSGRDNGNGNGASNEASHIEELIEDEIPF